MGETPPRRHPAAGRPGRASVRLEKLWQQFLEERQSIMVHKWIESQKAGHDIGMEQAILDWLRLNPPPCNRLCQVCGL